MHHPLIHLTNYCNDEGYDIFPLKKGSKFIATVWKDGVLKKKGEKLFESHIQCQKESYNKLFKFLNT